jgi:hydroxymethylglutaryl-CoA synthase
LSTGCGIRTWGFAIPRRRLSNQTVQEAWQRPGFPGTRSVAGPDEDSLTLGVQAAYEAIVDIDRATLDCLIFASTTGVFAERSNAALICSTLELGDETRCFDIGASLRAGASAFETACDLVSGGVCRNVLVVAADVRNTRPGRPDEFLFGHAGAAVVIGPAQDAIVEIVGHCRHVSSQIDTWRTAGSEFPHSSDLRFARSRAYMRPMQAVLTGILGKTTWSAGDVDKVVIYSPDVKSGAGLLKKNGFDLRRQYSDPASPYIELTGVAHLLVMLCATLEKSTSGERLLALGYGDGASACALRVTADIEHSRFSTALEQGYDISYNQFLALHNLLARDKDGDGGFTSEIMEQRNQPLWYALAAKRCRSCGTVIALPLPGCPHCPETTELEAFTLSRTGTVFSITHEHYYPTPEPPLGMATVDLDGGGRLTLQGADECTPLQVGDKVELVFRRLHNAGGRPNYFWKCRSVANLEKKNAQ